LFDTDHEFIEHRTVTAPLPDGSWGADFTVASGAYHVMCWANAEVSQLPTLSVGDLMDDAKITVAQTGRTDSRIYYAPAKDASLRATARSTTRQTTNYNIYRVYAPQGERTTKQMDFARAHRTVEVFISGYETSSYYDGNAPIVERSGARANYNFLLDAAPTNMTFRQTGTTPATPTHYTLSATFHSALTPLQGDGWVSIYHPTTNALIDQVKIEDYITTNNIADDSYVPIHFIFGMSPNVTITMPSWIGNPITPEITK
jgi:hypothetical protein